MTLITHLQYAFSVGNNVKVVEFVGWKSVV